MSAEDTVSTAAIQAGAARNIAIEVATAAFHATLQELSPHSEESHPFYQEVIADTTHAGDPARAVDAEAMSAAQRAILQSSSTHGKLIGNMNDVVVIGEESGTQTRVLKPGDLIVRCDPLDGTSNAVNLLFGFASVAAIDIVRSDARRPRHLGGAIIGGMFDLAWENHSPRSPRTSEYVRAAGRVFVRCPRLSDQWTEVAVPEEARNRQTVASVAASRKRIEAFSSFRDSVLKDGGSVYHLGGNPLGAALIIGKIGSIVETQFVTLHDSVFLVPHWLLGGRIEDLNGQALDYLAIYEREASVARPDHKPIPPYLAYYGERPDFASRIGGVRESKSRDVRESGESRGAPAIDSDSPFEET